MDNNKEVNQTNCTHNILVLSGKRRSAEKKLYIIQIPARITIYLSTSITSYVHAKKLFVIMQLLQ